MAAMMQEPSCAGLTLLKPAGGDNRA